MGALDHTLKLFKKTACTSGGIHTWGMSVGCVIEGQQEERRFGIRC